LRPFAPPPRKLFANDTQFHAVVARPASLASRQSPYVSQVLAAPKGRRSSDFREVLP
jgi:hypothetical protein